MLACGFVGGDMSKVGMIETESGRGEALAGHPQLGGYLVLSLRDDFSPANYGAAIKAAEKAGLQALIIDSASHEWEGAGGVLSMAADNQAAGKKGPIVWQKPKIDHQREFMLRLMQTSIPLVIVCMRAKYPMKEVVVNGKKEWTRSTVLDPKQADDILFEMFVHGWIDDAHNFRGTKYTLPELREVLRDGEPMSIDTGKRLAQWSAGAAPSTPAAPATQRPTVPPENAESEAAGTYITDEQAIALDARCQENGISTATFKAKAGVERIAQIKAADFEKANKWIDRVIAERKTKQGAA
jgi:hypothetical protein